MQLGMVGLGRMGGNMAERLRRGGHEVVGWTRDPQKSDVPTLEDLVARLESPRVAWTMLPAGEPTEHAVFALAEEMEEGDLVVDGANSSFRDSMRRAGMLEERGLAFVDAGVSGGIWGLDEGYCLMVGGSEEAFGRIEPALATLAPEDGYAHVGPAGAGHFVKTIHNGIEYGLMQAYAEGLDILQGSADFPDLDVHQVAQVWRHGSVVRSWLLDLTVRALEADPGLETLEAWVEDSGHGRSTVHEAIEEGVPVPVIAASLFARFASRQENSYALRLVAALRREFGGHRVREG